MCGLNTGFAPKSQYVSRSAGCRESLRISSHCGGAGEPVCPFPFAAAIGKSRPSMPALIVIPARLKATRLPDKPLAMIGDAPMIIHVWRRAVAANAGPVIVAAGDREI